MKTIKMMRRVNGTSKKVVPVIQKGMNEIFNSLGVQVGVVVGQFVFLLQETLVALNVHPQKVHQETLVPTLCLFHGHAKNTQEQTQPVLADEKMFRPQRMHQVWQRENLE